MRTSLLMLSVMLLSGDAGTAIAQVNRIADPGFELQPDAGRSSWIGTQNGGQPIFERSEHGHNDGLFPQPNLRALVENVRLYHKLGAKGVFMETDAPGLNSGIHCDADMTYWVLMEAMWDPTRTADDPIRDFCSHYYGPASDAIIRYVILLEEAYARDPHRQAFHVGNYALQSFVDLDLITACQGLFDQAEQARDRDGVHFCPRAPRTAVPEPPDALQPAAAALGVQSAT